MKIQSITFNKYKNLKRFNLDCSRHNGLSIVIGNNGSGKSNLLEALSAIFYKKYTGENISIKKFKIIYKNFSDQTILLNEQIGNPPNRIIAIYSGEENRLWSLYYEKLYKNYIKNITQNTGIEYPKMLYLNKFYWDIALLCLICSDAQDVKQFVKTQLGITKINYVEFKKGNPKFKNSVVKSFVDNLKNKYTHEEVKKELGHDPELFLKCYIASTDKDNKLLSDVIVNFNNDQTLAELSEGQKKQLLIKAALEFAGQENTIYLLDEPDAHIHVANKKCIFDIVSEYTENRHIIFTTHSPSICKISKKYNYNDSLILLENGSPIDLRDNFEIAKKLINEEDIFKLFFSSKSIILCEGKTDDLYISKSLTHFKDEFPSLDLDFIRVGGTDKDNIKTMLDKITVEQGRKIIIMTDRDDAGHNVYKALFNSNTDKKDIDYKLYKENIYFLMIPPIDSENCNGCFQVENYFGNTLIRSLAKEYIDDSYTDTNAFTDLSNKLQDKIKLKLKDKIDDPNNMYGFKVLLNKLQDIVNI